MSRFPPEFVPPRHNHITRDIKALGEGCPGCDHYHQTQATKSRVVTPRCPSCGTQTTLKPPTRCKLPSKHRLIPRNHGGLGKSPA